MSRSLPSTASMVLLGLSVLSAPRPVAAAATPESIAIEGNVALPVAVYRAVMARSSTVTDRADALDAARAAADVIEDFLVEAGYELAVTTATVTADGEPRVVLDEGRLDRIIFIGAGSGTALGYKLSLNLPGRVFNRGVVEAELRRLVRESGVAAATYELVPTARRRAGLLKVDVPTKLATVTLFRPAASQELRVYVEPKPWAPGFRLGFGFSPPDGLSADARWRFADVFLDDDRLDLTAGLSVDILDLANEPEDRLGLTRALAELEWFTPPLGVDWLRFSVKLSGQVLGRDREDIGIDSYLFSPLAASGNVGFFFDRFTAYLGGGVEQRFIYRLRLVEDAPDPFAVPVPANNLRPFLAFGSRWVLSKTEIRRDRQEVISLDGRLLGMGSSESDGQLELLARYRRAWMVGWDEVRLGLNGAYLSDAVPFFNEVAFGDGFVRAAFLDEIFTRRIASVQLEYRASLIRDDLKLSLFNDIAVYEALDEGRRGDGAELTNNVGIGLHILAIEMFQVDIYTGFGITTGGVTDVDLSVSATQVF